MALNIPQLFTPQDCRRLGAQLRSHNAVVALCPTGSPRQTVDVMLFFRNELRKCGITVLVFVLENAIEDLERLSTSEDLNFIYRINSIDILQHCAFINILCTYDIFLQNSRTWPIDKIILFPHNMLYEVPGITSFWMDYAVAQNKKQVNFDFSRYPNSVKYFRNRFLTVIPAGYPKLDLLIEARRRLGEGPLGRVAFFPTTREWGHYVSDPVLLRELIWLIEVFFQRWPDHQFVLRPRTEDFNDSVFRAVERYFSSDPRFIYDTGRDNKKYLVSSDILFTDNSAVEVNFAYATLQPVIRLKIGKRSIPSPFRTGARGYWVTSAANALAALEDALARREEWKAAITAERSRELCNPGTACAYLAAAVDDLLADRTAPDWRIIDKGNTPYDRVADYLRLLTSPYHLWRPINVPNVLTWAVAQHGKNKSIGMAALSACVRSWSGYHTVGDWLHLRNQIEWALTFVPLAQTARLFGHLARKRPQEAAAWLWQAEVLTRLEPETPLPGEVESRLFAPQPDLILCANAIRLQILRGNDPAAALARLQDVQPDFSTSLPEHVLAVYCLALLFNGRVDRAEACLTVWQSVKTANWWAEERRFCTALSQFLQEGHACPRWGTEGPATLRCLSLPLSFASEKQAHGFRKKFPEAQAASGWPFTGFYRPQNLANSKE